MVEWDEMHVNNLLEDSSNVLIKNHSWLTLDWLWDLEILNARAAINVESGLIRKNSELYLSLDDLSIPIREFGIFLHDKEIYELARIWSEREPDEYDEEAWAEIDLLRFMIPPSLLANRMHLLSKYGLKFPEFMKDNLITSAYSENTPEIRAGDSVALSANSDGNSSYIEGIVSGVQVLRSAKRLGESVNDTLKRFHRLAPLRLTIPEFNIDQLMKISLDEVDLIILSKDLSGRAPWIRNDVSFIHILMSADRIGESIKDTLHRFRILSPIGLTIPDFNIEKLSNTSLSDDDLKILSEYFDGKAPWIDGNPSLWHLVLMAKEFDVSIGDILKMLQRCQWQSQIPQ